MAVAAGDSSGATGCRRQQRGGGGCSEGSEAGVAVFGGSVFS